ncbi:MAG: prephenate dehydrogenase [Blastopirellula sp.]|nr:MAG: prephenate dehydrogenase [Blastopirellula sp.]
MPKYDTIAIYGVGLIGGSIGLALRNGKLASRVIGIGRRESTLQQAADCGAIDEFTLDLAAGVAEAEIIVVCSPVQLIAEHVLAVSQNCRADALITDAGSTKQRIVAQLASGTPVPQFIGSHPLAGSDKSGAENARADLFSGCTTIVTPTEKSNEQQLAALTQFWEAIGCTVKQMSPAEHDKALALTSHLPHVIASLLAASTPEELLPLTATGWADTTRIAKGDVQLWQQILDSNREPMLQALDNFAAMFGEFRQALASGDDAQFISILDQGKNHRDTVGS